MPLVPDRAFAAAAMLAALHQVDPDAVGLGAEKETTLEDEIKRWTRAFETVDEQHERALPRGGGAAVRDDAARRSQTAVCHGDYRLGNMLCDGADVAALIDWEIWSLLGSPPRPRVVPVLHRRGQAPDGEQSRPDRHADRRGPATTAYVDESGAEPANMEWFHCLIRYKEAAATALLMKRAVKAGAADAGENWVTAIPALTAECIERLQKFEPSR